MGQTPSVLVIEDDPEYAQLVTTVLAGSGPFDVKVALTLADGLESLARFNPHVILLDLDLPDASGYDTFLRVRARTRGTPIIVLTGLDDDDTAVRAAADGAQDYLVKGLLQPKLIARYVNMALSRQARLVTPKPPAQVIGFIGSKGGVGTSTVAANVAAHLAQSGCDTLVIEFQPGPGTLAAYLPAKPAYGLNSLLEIPAGRLTDADLQRGSMAAGPNLRMLCPGASRSPAIHAHADHAQAIVFAARQICACVILDLPPRVDHGVAAALRLCDSIALIIDRETSSICSSADMLEQIRAAGPEQNRVRLVAVDRTNPEIPVPLAEIVNRLKMHPVVLLPHSASGVSRSQAARTPLAWLFPDDRFSVALLELTEHLMASAPGFPVRAKTQWNTLKAGDHRLVPSDDYFG